MRLIDADALKEEVKTLFCPDGYKIMMLERIDNAPTVECVNEEEVKNIENELKKVLRKLRENNNG